MKRIIISVIIIAIIGMSWLMYFKNIITTNIDYNNAMDKGNKLYERKLYDPAIDNYKSALELKESKECRYKILNAYKKRSESPEIYGTNVNQEYIEELESVFADYGDDYKLAIRLSDAYIHDDEYEDAYNILLKAKGNGCTEKKLIKKIEKLKIMYELNDIKVAEFRPFFGGYSTVSNGIQWGVLSSDGTLEKPFENNYENQINANGCILIQKNKDVVLYDEDNKVLGRFGTDVEDASMFSENRIAVKKDGKFDIYDKTGKKKFGSFDFVSTFKKGEAVVSNNNKLSVVDKNGEQIKELDVDRIVFDNGNFYENSGVVVASKNNKFSLYDTDFKQLIDESYDEIGVPTPNKIYAFKKGDKWGFINDGGEEIIKPEYEDAKSFSNGIAAVKQGGKWGFINQNKKLIIKCQFEDAGYFTKDGTCLVKCKDAYEESGFIWKLLKFEVGLPSED